MTSTVRQQVKYPCLICGKMVGVFTCRGCAGNFCLRHTSEHREYLQKTLNDILYNYDIFKRNFKEQNTEQYQHVFLEEIDRWEQESIEKIRQYAESIRKELIITLRDYKKDFQARLDELKQQIDTANQDGGFYENDLRQWSEKLNDLQRIYIDQQAVKIEEDIDSISFIPKISLNFLLNKRRDSQNPYEDYSTLKQKDEYSSGKHLLRFKIEQYEPNSSILFGVISKSASNISNPYKNPTFYGWTERNIAYLAGIPEANLNGYVSDFQSNDICILTIDCNQEMINLTNERTQCSYDLEIDLTKCPFPWESNVHLFNEDD